MATDESFQRAKSFWQTRDARSRSIESIAMEPVKRRVSSAEPPGVLPPPQKALESSKSFAKRIAPFSNASAAQSAVPPAFAGAVAAANPPVPVHEAIPTTAAATDFRPSIVPVSAAPNHSPTTPMTPAPDHTMPLPSAEPTAKPIASASAAAPALASTSSAAAVVNSMLKTLADAKPSTSALPSLPVQLPDMSSWKEKMKSYSNKSKATGASMRTLSFANLSSSWKSMSASSDASGSPEKGSSPSAGANAKLNIHNPSHGRTKVQSSALTTGSPYGELIVAEVLSARDLSVGDFVQGESDPFVTVRFEGKAKTSAVAKATVQPVYNERFVFWVPSSPAIDQQVVSITVMNKNKVISDEHLGEVHISLAIPVNESFDEWYPLVREDGAKKGCVRVGVRRMVLTSPSLLLAAQSMAAQERSLNDADLRAHGATIPELWYGFAEAQQPATDDSRPTQADVLANKLNHFSRRFIGIELTSTGDSGSRRDVF
ncbi:hypothetical protein PybrP1_009478 [[Pythium] brassicae (nom. inval.)]|nr:hypothetical protein PybrP1_009478 [[Pythium] brassicae (nom. inval.)]